MKLHALALPLLPLALLAAPACKSSDKGASTGATITKAADQIQRGIEQLDATVAALHDLVEKPAPDLKPQQKAYEKALASLESTAESLSKTAASMDTRGQAYFAEWDTQLAAIQNEDIRERSADRKKSIEASFSKLQKQYGEARDAFRPLLDNLRDVRTALKADLTLAGIDTLKPVVKKVDKEKGSVEKELKEVGEQFRELGVDLSRSGPPAEGEARK
ncbi:MAG TPA: DUF2959 family protein [Planctomycetota bacterium]